MTWNNSKYEPCPEQTPLETICTPVEPAQKYCEPPDQDPRSSRPRALWTLLWEWNWEFATWLLGSCALFSNVALLSRFQDRPLEEWTFEIRLATVVAALSQIAQSALLVSVSACIGQLKWEWLRKKHSASDLKRFEEASRGPQGSLMLLPKTKLHLVSVGALATILLLVFSPFTQQSNTIRFRSIDRTGASSNASISRAVQYMNFDWDTTLMPFQPTRLFNTSRTVTSEFHPHMFNALLAGMLDNAKSISDVKGNCSAEACKWEKYTTLAICNTVDDISSSVEIRDKIARISSASWEPPAQPNDMPDSFWMTVPDPIYPDIKDEKLPPLANMFVAYFPQCNEHNLTREDSWAKDRLNSSNWKAHKATLSLCLQTLESTFNKTMKTTIVDTSRDLNWGYANGSQPEGTVCLTQTYDGLDFCLGRDDLWRWSSAIQKTWEGAALLLRGADNYYTGQWVPNIIGDILGPTPAVCDPNLGPGYGFQGFTRRVQNIAISMSNALRTGNTTSADFFVEGSEWYSEQYIEVDLAWLIFPGAVYTLITLFFLATVAISRRGDRPLWKSSPLVLLQVADSNNSMNTLKSLEKEADTTQIQLKYTGKNWYLRGIVG